MLRTLFLILVFYVTCLAVIDAVSYDGRYRKMVMQEANTQVYRVHAEVRSFLVKIGI
jgi:hypothetical protein